MDSKAREFAAEHRRYLQENLPHVLEEMRRDGDPRPIQVNRFGCPVRYGR
jgi:hypothetical protein